VRQIVPLFFLPIGISLMLILAGLFLRRRSLIWVSVVLLWLASTPLVSAPLMRATEQWAVRTPAAAAPSADAIVVLSFGRMLAPGDAAISEWEDPDRFFGGVELFQARKAPLLVFTGAVSGAIRGSPLEGDVLAAYARALGVPEDHILTTGPVTTTEQEAAAVTVLLREHRVPPRILLVTSAFHMPRARRLFERAGFTVAPFPVDFRQQIGGRFGLFDVLPSAGTLGRTEVALRELYGRAFYRIKGP
jgi:uncharacterized SAM-binding protein YcdF (DUF218 family)